ncbi:hypothetical protein KEM52_004186, partial [Ascosphaera acerosa]
MLGDFKATSYDVSSSSAAMLLSRVREARLLLGCLAAAAIVRGESCENGPTSRRCWGSHSIDSDYYSQAPETNILRE